jgi:hypothetical protein
MRRATFPFGIGAALALLLAAACGDGRGLMDPDDAEIRRTNHSCSDPANPCDVAPVGTIWDDEDDPPPPSSECEIFPWTCDGYGGAGGGEGPGGGGSAGGESGFTWSENDAIVTDTLPNCGQVQTENWMHAYCGSLPPVGERLARTEAAFERIEQRGAECANIAAFGRQLLAAGGLRYFQQQDWYEEYAGWGSPALGAMLASFWVDQFGAPGGTGQRNFDNKLVHEIEHAMGRLDHPTPDQTANSYHCAAF